MLLFIFGEGEKSTQVIYEISTSGIWTISSYHHNPYFNLEKRDMDNVQEINEKYDKLIEEAANIYIMYLKKIGKSKDTIKMESDFLDELIHNEKNDILVKIERYEENEINLEYSKSNLLWQIMAIIGDVSYGFFLYWLFKKNKIKFNDLSVDEGMLKEANIDLNIRDLFYAPLKYCEAFLLAEKERILAINDVLTNNNGSDEILSKYEKKLIK